jgi:excisionase family DNA binding protein
MLIDSLDAAHLLATSMEKVEAMVRANEIPFVRLPSGDVRFLESDLRQWIAERGSRPDRFYSEAEMEAGKAEVLAAYLLPTEEEKHSTEEEKPA